MIKTNSGHAPTDAQWANLLGRSPSDDLYAVVTTGIVCRTGCTARTPLRKNIRLFANLHEALDAGFRPCKRCQPNTDHPVSRVKASIAVVPNLEFP